MWIKYKAKEGDTLQSIVKQFRIKDPDTILKHPKNRKCLPLLKKKGATLTKGSEIWLPDPRAKAFLIKGPRGQTVLTEKEYQTLLSNVHKTMDRAYSALRIRYTYAIGRHDTQCKINDNQWFVSFVVNRFSSVDEPMKSRMRAGRALIQLAQTTKGRKYKKFASELETAEEVITAYTNDVHKWVGDLIGSAERTVARLKMVKEVGKFCGTVVAVTLAAPASLSAGVLVGALSNTGVSLTFDGADALGRMDAGLKQRSPGDIAKRVAANAIAGAAGGAIAGGIAKYAAKPLVNALASRPVMTTQLSRLSQSRLVSRVLDQEAKAVAKELVKVNAEAFSKGIQNFPERVVTKAITKFFVRFGTSGFSKLLNSNGDVNREIATWMTQNPAKVGQKSGEAVGAAAATDLANGRIADILYAQVLASKEAEFRKILRAEMEAYVKAQSKR
ncbi:hypothetical protein Q5Y75_16005 [Ruegeria sp. 2205SS24-7]|uniref:hypothetical protein n=1 Tax=Ruegeria discodermiae TaxID=3064389 RepID=UPI0027411452|nr:hypothetical protein [Ruegeria sp. 2205SS24-7]MDP5218733.1 hypothetical protein [Ruegeria sp. 2205SS24-7]